MATLVEAQAVLQKAKDNCAKGGIGSSVYCDAIPSLEQQVKDLTPIPVVITPKDNIKARRAGGIIILVLALVAFIWVGVKKGWFKRKGSTGSVSASTSGSGQMSSDKKNILKWTIGSIVAISMIVILAGVFSKKTTTINSTTGGGGSIESQQSAGVFDSIIGFFGF